MSVGTPVAADVPGLFDVIINGKGYMLYRPIETSLPFRTQRSRMGYSPTFLERTNVSGDYGDDQQAFWLTATQRDWSLGEDQKFFKSTDADSERKYWLGSKIDVSIPGQTSINYAQTDITFAGVIGVCYGNYGQNLIFAATATNLYSIVTTTAVVTDLGAHGCGGIPTTMTHDGTFLYISGYTCTTVRKWDGTNFTTFSTQEAEFLTFLNNTLYGTFGSVLYTYSTGGVATASFTWQTATGAAWSSANMQIIPYGGQVAILQSSITPDGPILWLYDGVGVQRKAQFPPGLIINSFCVVSGIIFLCGTETKRGDGFRPVIYYYTAGGTFGKAWSTPTYSVNQARVCCTPFASGFLFNDFVNQVIRYYDLSTGGVSTVATSVQTNSSSSWSNMSSTFGVALFTNIVTSQGNLLWSSTKATSAIIYSSIFDFDSSLTKMLRGVTVNFVAATDGDGGSVDVYYQLNDAGGTYTLLATGVTSGIETTFPSNTTASGVSLKVVINKGTSTLGPILKRTYVRAVPVLQSYRNCEYILDCSGRDGKSPLILNDNETPHPLDGLAQVTNINTATSSTSPISVTDRFGTFNSIIEPDKTEIIEISPEEYIVRVAVRQV